MDRTLLEKGTISAMIWAQQLDAKGITHLPITADLPILDGGNEPHRLVLWSGERPVGQIDRPCSDKQLLKLWQDALNRAETGKTPDEDTVAASTSVSLVICTRDRPADLVRCLASIPKQTLTPDQVIVVDNCSTSSEVEAVCRAAGVQYVYEPIPGLDIARNRGAEAATGAIVAYTDDDVVLHPHWLARLVAAFDDPTVRAVTGLVLPAELATEAQWHFERHWGFGRGFSRIDFGQEFFSHDQQYGTEVWKIGAGASMAFRRVVFDQVGGFDERLDVGAAGCSGDSEFWHRILTAGGICRYEPSAVAFHYHRREIEKLRLQIWAYMRGHAAALLVQYERTRHLGNLRRLVYDLPGMYAKRIAISLLRGRKEVDLFTTTEIAGVLSGVVFYLRSPKPGIARFYTGVPDRLGNHPSNSHRVSVVIPACNAESTLDETLQSVRAQSHANLEIIVVDDGSTDQTRSIANAHASVDRRVKVIAQANAGVAAARNIGWRSASAELIAFVDADDLWAKSKIERQVKTMLSAGDTVGLVYTWFARIDENSSILEARPQPTARGNVVDRLLLGNVVGNGSSAMVRRQVLEDVGGFDSDLQAAGAHGCEDLLFYFRVATKFEFAIIPEYLTGYRILSERMSSDRSRMLRSWMLVADEMKLRYPEKSDLVERGFRFYVGYLLIDATARCDLRQARSIFSFGLSQHSKGSLVPTIGTLLRALTLGLVQGIELRRNRSRAEDRPHFSIGEPNTLTTS